MNGARPIRALLTTLLITAAVSLGLSAPANAEPPNIPSASTARTQLNGLTVAPAGSMTGYSREKFPHWITISGACNTRETVLKRDGRNVQVNASCAATSGSWHSPYDGATWTAASDVDIDHIVPLAAAWRSGAANWTTAKRQQFANDLTNSQLIAVTDNVNQAKGDKTPDLWKPPLGSYHCTYARMWTGAKHAWGLTVTAAEKGALSGMLSSC
ncbi:MULTISPECIES: HNH endonuclease family protein [unclassified Crossiella]|uniref:HNH endonuclease family protein n=1 Tax=unclassified Crossiella TaxID=2620835 RepID=UPI001FFEE5F1|nr:MULTISPECIES: HNH endonuclease family protein [unclassified Crossiella]MCK2236397.1 HNH endonuclease family protein [Crossiella sp. S99.2]MCK2250064.1 HNH endonuclease family protein [Crossiella sp. S99.1]